LINSGSKELNVQSAVLSTGEDQKAKQIVEIAIALVLINSLEIKRSSISMKAN